MADVVAEVASEQRVLFFTCHPGTRDLLVRAAAARAATAGGRTARVEELGRTG
ncbi:hypothetical protein AB0L40_22125 [Patulibacter sp. NPDC049589]|uniref:hypothetical protein n=1 Tax=Patulibacter sp. NPDC049589 TaxID=3154731 RepID=UPI0034171E0F